MAAERAPTVSPDEADELVAAFNHVTYYLLRQQLEDFRAGRHVGNFVDPAGLLRREREELRLSLRAIERFRTETRAAFTGAVF